MSDIVKRDVGVTRENLPQIEQKDLPQLLRHLKDNNVPLVVGNCSADKLRPIQKEFNSQKVKRLVSDIENIQRQPLLINDQGFILDGHHRWLALKSESLPVRYIKIGLPLREAIDSLFAFDKTKTKSVEEGTVMLASLMGEDWKFEPAAAAPTVATNDPDDDKDKLPPYHITHDASTKKSERARRRYHKKNTTQSFAHMDYNAGKKSTSF